MKCENKIWRIRGRDVTQSDLEWIKSYRLKYPDARRKRIAIALCDHWQWCNGRGQPKEMAARDLLNKLANKGLVELPPLRKWVRRNTSGGRCSSNKPSYGEPIEGPLTALRPLSFEIVQEGHACQKLWAGYLRYYHYLGLHIVGENIGYLVRDKQGRNIAALLFSAAAWRCEARDKHLGWTDQERSDGLQYIANNSRFLILPWVRVPHLASHILGRIQRQINKDWLTKYGYKLQWLETFVDTERFAGTCYRAANWLVVGQTKGRSRQDRYKNMKVSRKFVLLYSLGLKGRLS